LKRNYGKQSEREKYCELTAPPTKDTSLRFLGFISVAEKNLENFHENDEQIKTLVQKREIKETMPRHVSHYFLFFFTKKKL
jgi:hypothetical protein